MPTSTSTFHAPARVPSRVAPAPAAVARPTVAPAPAVARVALVGNHVPRRCGIATFTADLTDALAAARPQLECFVVAMDEPGGGHAYPPRVSGTIVADQLSQYQAAAAAVNASGADVVSLQHEYGIYGGPAGAHVLTLVRALRVPVVTTLHTILAAPNPAQRAVMDELTRRSQRLVVMSARGAELLRALHDVPAAKIDLIPHGIPDFPATAPAAPASLLTFGLLARDKGLEYVIDAMPAILRRHPGATNVNVGATHPHVRAHDGEAYRDMLRARAAAAGVAGNVIFHDRFVDKAELAAFLGAATIYVTPYLKPEQITSGTLAFAVGAGKAVISTPYVYAEELLAEGRGLLVPARDPAAIAAAVIGLLDDPAACQAMSARAATYGRAMAWPQVARAYLDSFAHARADHAAARDDAAADPGDAAAAGAGPRRSPDRRHRHPAARAGHRAALRRRLLPRRQRPGAAAERAARAARRRRPGRDPVPGRALPGLRQPRAHRRRPVPQLHGLPARVDRAPRLRRQPRPGAVGAGRDRRPQRRGRPPPRRRPAAARRPAGGGGDGEPARLGLRAARPRRRARRRRRRSRADRGAHDRRRPPARPVPPHRDRGVAVVRGPPHLLQPAAVRGADRHRPGRGRSRR